MTLLAQRFRHGLLVLLLLVIAAFAVSRFIGDPGVGMLGDRATPADRAALRQTLGLDKPLLWQLGRYLGRVATGDLGTSYRLGQPVTKLFGERLPATLELAFCALVLTLLLGLPLGVWLAAARDGPLRRAVDILALLGASTPTFAIGIGLILLFSVAVPWLPPFGRGATVDIFGWPTSLLTGAGWRCVALPAATLAVYESAMLCRLVRVAMTDTLARPHVMFARARGLAEWRVRYLHALPAALPAVLPALGLQVGHLLVYTAVTETVFQWPGMGGLFVQAALFGDLPVLSGYLLYIGAVFVVINAVVDLALARLDRRGFGSGGRDGLAGRA